MSRPLRVLSLSTLYPSAANPGFGLFVARQAEAVAARGDVALTVCNPIGLPPFPFSLHPRYRAQRAVPAQETRGGLPVLHPRFRLIPAIGGRWNASAIARAALAVIRPLHADQPFDLIDAQFFFPDGPAAAIIAQALGLPLSIKARGSDIQLWGTVPYAKAQMLDAAAQAGGMLSVSAALKHDMAALGMESDRISVHYTGLDGALFHPRPKEQARAGLADLLPTDGPLLASVGNLIPLKGHDLVLEALTHLPGVRLIVAGKGPEKESLRAKAEALGLADRAVIAGSLPPDRLAQLLAAADAMVLASEREGLANVWIEALASGTPLVIPDIGGAREVVREPSAGRIVARQPAAIAAGIADLLANPPAPAEVAAQAARFSWDANAAELSAHWHRLADRG